MKRKFSSEVFPGAINKVPVLVPSDQPKNRENAMRQLRSILYDKELQHRMAEQAKVEAGKKKIEWGSQIRSYVFDDRRVKDHRTNYQTSDVNGVMDGKIEDFIKAYLMEFSSQES
jgi:peptide chain release factor 2